MCLCIEPIFGLNRYQTIHIKLYKKKHQTNKNSIQIKLKLPCVRVTVNNAGLVRYDIVVLFPVIGGIAQVAIAHLSRPLQIQCLKLVSCFFGLFLSVDWRKDLFFLFFASLQLDWRTQCKRQHCLECVSLAHKIFNATVYCIGVASNITYTHIHTHAFTTKSNWYNKIELHNYWLSSRCVYPPNLNRILGYRNNHNNKQNEPSAKLMKSIGNLISTAVRFFTSHSISIECGERLYYTVFDDCFHSVCV